MAPKAAFFSMDIALLNACSIPPPCCDARRSCSCIMADLCIEESACQARTSLRSDTQGVMLKTAKEFRSLRVLKRLHKRQNIPFPSSDWYTTDTFSPIRGHTCLAYASKNWRWTSSRNERVERDHWNSPHPFLISSPLSQRGTAPRYHTLGRTLMIMQFYYY